MSGDHISSLMNAMINRLEYTQKEMLKDVPEEKYWSLIDIYVTLDEVLASLYKQYTDAKKNLGNLILTNGSDDPMTEIAWDMHDSARAAVDTRLLELKDDEDTTRRVTQLKALKNTPPTEYKKPRSPSQSLDEMMVFMLWASMVMNSNARRQDIRRDFGQAC